MAQEEEPMIYNAVKTPLDRKSEREQIEQATREFLKKKGKIQVIPFGVSAEKDSYTFDERKGYAYKVADVKGNAPKNKGVDKKKFLWEHDWKGVVFGSVTILRRSKEESRNGAMWIAACSCGNEFPVPSGKIRQKQVKCLRCGGKS